MDTEQDFELCLPTACPAGPDQRDCGRCQRFTGRKRAKDHEEYAA